MLIFFRAEEYLDKKQINKKKTNTTTQETHFHRSFTSWSFLYPGISQSSYFFLFSAAIWSRLLNPSVSCGDKSLSRPYLMQKDVFPACCSLGVALHGVIFIQENWVKSRCRTCPICFGNTSGLLCALSLLL